MHGLRPLLAVLWTSLSLSAFAVGAAHAEMLAAAAPRSLSHARWPIVSCRFDILGV